MLGLLGFITGLARAGYLGGRHGRHSSGHAGNFEKALTRRRAAFKAARKARRKNRK